MLLSGLRLRQKQKRCRTTRSDDRPVDLILAPEIRTLPAADQTCRTKSFLGIICSAMRCLCVALLTFVPLKGGGIDVVAILTARMKGWRTRTFTDKTYVHHRPMGSAVHEHRLVARFKLDQSDYRLGFHPLWQLFRSIYQMSNKPYIIGGVTLFLGSSWSMLRRVERSVSHELADFQGREQMKRLKSFFETRVVIRPVNPSR
jgi:biofilm PGA synthesis N-glycosyltransferase PgaC